MIRLSAGLDHRLRRGLEETIDQENDVERQPGFGHLGRSAHVDEHADDIALLTNVDAVPVADKIGPDIGRQHRNDGDIALRPKLACKPDRRVATGADAREHEGLASRRSRQRAAIADYANPAGRTSRPAAADAGMRHVEAQAGLEDAETSGHAHAPVGV